MAQYPVGWLADKFDRRWVLIWLSVAAVLACGTTVLVGAAGTTMVMLNAGFFGLVSFPIFSVASAHANDFATSEERVELSAALMFFYAIGAIAAPLFASNLIDWFGPSALFYMLAAGHALLIVFGLSRMRVRDSGGNRTRYVYAPRTSFTIGRLMGRQREKRDPETEDNT